MNWYLNAMLRKDPSQTCKANDRILILILIHRKHKRNYRCCKRMIFAVKNEFDSETIAEGFDEIRVRAWERVLAPGTEHVGLCACGSDCGRQDSSGSAGDWERLRVDRKLVRACRWFCAWNHVRNEACGYFLIRLKIIYFIENRDQFQIWWVIEWNSRRRFSPRLQFLERNQCRFNLPQEYRDWKITKNL